jgi:hypothetical protein
MTASFSPPPETPPPSPVGRSRLWFGVLAAPVAWVLAEVVGYIAVSLSCLGPRGAPGGSGTTYASGGLIIITIVTAIAAIAGLFTGYRSWQIIRQTRAANQPVPSYASFMVFAGIFVSLIFLLSIILFGIPAVIVNACSEAR